VAGTGQDSNVVMGEESMRGRGRRSPRVGFVESDCLPPPPKRSTRRRQLS
jgi:hypothetical protein